MKSIAEITAIVRTGNPHDLTTNELLSFCNAHNKKQIKKFENKTTAIARALLTADSLSDSPAPKNKALSATRAEAISRTWKNSKVRAARGTRDKVQVDGVIYRSTHAAFVALNLPLTECIRFRMDLKASGSADGYGKSWKIVS